MNTGTLMLTVVSTVLVATVWGTMSMGSWQFWSLTVALAANLLGITYIGESLNQAGRSD